MPTDNTFLNDLELEKVRQFNDDEVMREAVKKVILETVYACGVLKKGKKADPLHNMALVYVSMNKDATNDQVGAHMRALYEGINFVEMGFGAIAKYKKDPLPTPKGQNQAR